MNYNRRFLRLPLIAAFAFLLLACQKERTTTASGVLYSAYSGKPIPNANMWLFAYDGYEKDSGDRRLTEMNAYPTEGRFLIHDCRLLM